MFFFIARTACQQPQQLLLAGLYLDQNTTDGVNRDPLSRASSQHTRCILFGTGGRPRQPAVNRTKLTNTRASAFPRHRIRVETTNHHRDRIIDDQTENLSLRIQKILTKFRFISIIVPGTIRHVDPPFINRTKIYSDQRVLRLAINRLVPCERCTTKRPCGCPRSRGMERALLIAPALIALRQFSFLLEAKRHARKGARG